MKIELNFFFIMFIQVFINILRLKKQSSARKNYYLLTIISTVIILAVYLSNHKLLV